MCPCLLLFISWIAGFPFIQLSSLDSIFPTVLEGAVMGNGHMMAAAEGKGKAKDQHIVLVAIEFEFNSNRGLSPSLLV